MAATKLALDELLYRIRVQQCRADSVQEELVYVLSRLNNVENIKILTRQLLQLTSLTEQARDVEATVSLYESVLQACEARSDSILPATIVAAACDTLDTSPLHNMALLLAATPHITSPHLLLKRKAVKQLHALLQELLSQEAASVYLLATAWERSSNLVSQGLFTIILSCTTRLLFCQKGLYEAAHMVYTGPSDGVRSVTCYRYLHLLSRMVEDVVPHAGASEIIVHAQGWAEFSAKILEEYYSSDGADQKLSLLSRFQFGHVICAGPLARMLIRGNLSRNKARELASPSLQALNNFMFIPFEMDASLLPQFELIYLSWFDFLSGDNKRLAVSELERQYFAHGPLQSQLTHKQAYHRFVMFEMQEQMLQTDFSWVNTDRWVHLALSAVEMQFDGAAIISETKFRRLSESAHTVYNLFLTDSGMESFCSAYLSNYVNASLLAFFKGELSSEQLQLLVVNVYRFELRDTSARHDVLGRLTQEIITLKNKPDVSTSAIKGMLEAYVGVLPYVPIKHTSSFLSRVWDLFHIVPAQIRPEIRRYLVNCISTELDVERAALVTRWWAQGQEGFRVEGLDGYAPKL